MSEYISDSDQEDYYSLTQYDVSMEDISSVLSNIPFEQRGEAEQNLRNSRFASLLEDIKSRQFNENDTNGRDDIEEGTPTSSERNVIFNDIENNAPQLPNHASVNNVINEDNLDHEEQSENSSTLQAFLELREENSIRRSLRKRNFSSTHPYLADQALWLGLASKEHLNQMHEQDADFGTIIKFLNKVYIRKKKSHPKEDKYKAKNFYAFLGKGSTKTQQIIQGESSQGTQAYSNSADRQNSDSNGVSDYSETDEDEDIILPSRNRLNIDNYSTFEKNQNSHSLLSQESDSEMELIHLKEVCDIGSPVPPGNAIEIDENDASDLDLSDKYVRVGGRDRREKNVLKGLLPESAKRLEIYKSSKKSNSKSDSKEVKYRKGLAIKKVSSKKRDSYTSGDLYSFVDAENEFSDDPAQYLTHNTGSDHTEILALDRGADISDDTLSISSDESDVITISPSLSYPNYMNSFDSADNDFERQSPHDYQYDFINLTIAEAKRETTRKYSPYSKQSKIGERYNQRLPSINILQRRKKKKVKKKGIGMLRKKSVQGIRKAKGPHNGQNIRKALTLKKDHRRLFDSSYTFSREPIQSTLIFEAESSKKFVKSNHLQIRNPLNRVGVEDSFLKKEQKFPMGFILNEVEIEKVWKLSNGNVSFFSSDGLVITLIGEKYPFLLVDKASSCLNCTKLLSNLSNLFKDSGRLKAEILDEIYLSIRDLIKWSLVLQEPYNETNHQALTRLLNTMSMTKGRSDGEIKATYFPYILLLFRINSLFVNRLMLDGNDQWEDEFQIYSLDYWCIFLMNCNLDTVTAGSHSFESIYLMYSLFQKKNQWWNCINKALIRLSGKGSLTVKFDILFFLAPMVSSNDSNWSCFYTIYEECKNERESTNHENFIHIIYALHEKFSWPLEERLITSLYSSITARKFSNFEDEIVEPELLSHVRSRYDIPDYTFFERFMQLLYVYVSELPFGSNKKKLITKMFTSSNYHYEKGREHYVMFINRLNFILLLTKLSEIDLKNQMCNLAQQIRSSNNISIFEKMINGLSTYSSIALEKGNSFPVETFFILGQTFIDSYVTEPGFLRLWSKFSIVLKEFLIKSSSLCFGKIHLDLLQLLLKFDFKSFSDQISFEVCSLTCKFLDNLVMQKAETSKSNLFGTLIEDLQKNNQKLLNLYMGRFPVNDSLNESRIEQIVENSLKVWINCTYLSSEQNWNILVLQHFPYIGNSFSRQRFALFFYKELLKFADLEYCIDIVISTIMSELASFRCSKYLSSIIDSLKTKSTKNSYASYFKDVSHFQVQNFKLQTVSDIIKNISNNKETPFPTKKGYLSSYLKVLEKNYYEFYQFKDFSEFCKSSIRILEKNSFDFIETDESFISLCNKLGISYSHMQRTWVNLELKEKLGFIHNELSTAIAFNKDFISSLDKYISPETFELSYHLLSIYTKIIISNHTIYWLFICCILKYIFIKLSTHTVPISDGSFKSLLLIIADLPEIVDKYSTHEVSYYRHLTKYYVYNIYNHAYFVYDGFKDRHFLISLIDNVLDNTNRTSQIDYFAFSFSHYSLFDIQSHTRDNNIQIIDHLREEIDSAKDECDKSCNNLKIITKTSMNSISENLSFDL